MEQWLFLRMMLLKYLNQKKKTPVSSPNTFFFPCATMGPIIKSSPAFSGCPVSVPVAPPQKNNGCRGKNHSLPTSNGQNVVHKMQQMPKCAMIYIDLPMILPHPHGLKLGTNRIQTAVQNAASTAENDLDFVCTDCEAGQEGCSFLHRMTTFQATMLDCLDTCSNCSIMSMNSRCSSILLCQTGHGSGISLPSYPSNPNQRYSSVPSCAAQKPSKYPITKTNARGMLVVWHQGRLYLFLVTYIGKCHAASITSCNLLRFAILLQLSM